MEESDNGADPVDSDENEEQDDADLISKEGSDIFDSNTDSSADDRIEHGLSEDEEALKIDKLESDVVPYKKPEKE